MSEDQSLPVDPWDLSKVTRENILEYVGHFLFAVHDKVPVFANVDGERVVIGKAHIWDGNVITTFDKSPEARAYLEMLHNRAQYHLPLKVAEFEVEDVGTADS